MRLRDGGFVTNDVSLYLKLRGGEKHRAHQRIDATDRTSTLLTSVQTLYETLMRDREVRNATPMAVGMVLRTLAA